MSDQPGTSVIYSRVEVNMIDKANGDRVQKSDFFVLQHFKLQVQLTRGWGSTTNRTLKASLVNFSQTHHMLSPFYVRVFILKGGKTISYPKTKVIDPIKCFWSSTFSEIAKQFPGIEEESNISFRFLFQTESEPNYNQEKSRHKDVQTTSYLDDYSSKQRLSEDLAGLSEKGSGFDVELKCRGEVRKAHRAIIEARSQYLGDLLKASKNSSIELHSVDSEVFRVLCDYMYTGNLPELNFDIAEKIVGAGKLGDIGFLRQICETFLIENLKMDNCCKCLAIASDDGDFKDKIISYIIENEVPFVGEYWKPFNDNHFDLANAVLNKFAKALKGPEKST